MNSAQLLAKTKVSYSGITNSILKYMSMRSRMGKSIVTAEEIKNFFPSRILRKDTLLRNLNTMKKNGFIKQNANGYIITEVGKKIPFMVANSHQQKMVKLGQRVNLAHDWED